jgi:hypothetical protein
VVYIDFFGGKKAFIRKRIWGFGSEDGKEILKENRIPVGPPAGYFSLPPSL